MRATTSDQLIAATARIDAERNAAARAGQTEDAAVLDEEINDLRLTLLKLRWKERTCQTAIR